MELLGPPGLGYQGMVTDPAEALDVSLGRGMWALLQNGRTSGATIKARKGHLVLNPIPPLGCTSGLGLWPCTLNGIAYLAGAYSDGTKTRIYISSDFVNFSEITRGSGYDGDNRLSGTSITWTVFRTKRNRDANDLALRSWDVLVASDGASVIVFDPRRALYSSNISAATATSPIVCTTSAPHSYVNGQAVRIDGALGITGMNGIWTVANKTATTFELLGTSGTGIYTALSASNYTVQGFRHYLPAKVSGADGLVVTATYETYAPIAGATRTYSGTLVNAANHKFKDTNTTDNGATTPYVAGISGVCPFLQATSSATAGQVAELQLSASYTFQKQLCLILEGTTNAIADLLAGRLEVSNAADNPVAISTIGYFPTIASQTASAGSATTITGVYPGGAANGLAGKYVVILSGTGNAAWTPVLITASTATVLTVVAWPSGSPNNTSVHIVTDRTIQVTTATNHGRVTNDTVDIAGVVGTTEANAHWTVTKVSNTILTLNTSTLSHAYVSGGLVLTPYTIIFDPGSTDRALSTPPTIIDVTSGSSTVIKQVVFNIAAPVTFSYLRSVRLIAGSTSSGNVIILAMTSAGGYEGTTQLAYSTSLYHARAEGPGYFAQKIVADKISSFGGPTFVTGSPNAPAPTLPIPRQGVFYDLELTLPCPYLGTVGSYFSGATKTSVMAGGLAAIGGYGDIVNIYLKAAGSDTEDKTDFDYLMSVKLIAPGSGDAGSENWFYNYATSPITIKMSDFPLSQLTALDANSEVTLPTSFQLPIPPAAKYWSGGCRVFAAVPAEGGVAQTGQVWVSEFQNGARFADLPIAPDWNGVADEAGACVAQFSEGRIVKRVIGNSSDEGVSSVYAVTDSTIERMGAATSTGTSWSSKQLSNPQPVGSNGTNAPDAVVECQGALYFPDHNGIFVRYAPALSPFAQVQGVQPIGHRKVGDRIANLPVGRLPYLKGAALGKRIYWAYTPYLGSLNTRVLVFNTYFASEDSPYGMWESDDLLPSGWDVTDFQRLYDPSLAGSGQRLLAVTSTGKHFAFEEGGATDVDGNAVAFKLRSGTWWEAPSKERRRGGQSVLGEAFLWCSIVAGGSLNLDRYYLDTQVQFRTTIPLVDSEDASRPYVANADSLGSGQLQFVLLSAATNATPIVCTSTTPHGLSDAAAVTISGVLGNTAANGIRYVDVLTTLTFALYTDPDLAAGHRVIGNGAYTSGGVATYDPVNEEGSQRMYLELSGNVTPEWSMDRFAIDIEPRSETVGKR